MCGDVRLQTLVGLQAPQQPLQIAKAVVLLALAAHFSLPRLKKKRCKARGNCKQHVPPHTKITRHKTNQPSHLSPSPTTSTTLVIGRWAPTIKAVIVVSHHRAPRPSHHVSSFIVSPATRRHIVHLPYRRYQRSYLMPTITSLPPQLSFHLVTRVVPSTRTETNDHHNRCEWRATTTPYP